MSVLLTQLEPPFLACCSLKLLAAAVAREMPPCRMKGTADAKSPQEGTRPGASGEPVHTHSLGSILFCWGPEPVNYILQAISAASFPLGLDHWGRSVGDEAGGRERHLASLCSSSNHGDCQAASDSGRTLSSLSNLAYGSHANLL